MGVLAQAGGGAACQARGTGGFVGGALHARQGGGAKALHRLGQCLGGRSQPIGSDFAGSSIQVPAGADGVPGLAEALKSHTAEVKK